MERTSTITSNGRRLNMGLLVLAGIAIILYAASKKQPQDSQPQNAAQQDGAPAAVAGEGQSEGLNQFADHIMCQIALPQCDEGYHIVNTGKKSLCGPIYGCEPNEVAQPVAASDAGESAILQPAQKEATKADLLVQTDKAPSDNPMFVKGSTPSVPTLTAPLIATEPIAGTPQDYAPTEEKTYSPLTSQDAAIKAAQSPQPVSAPPVVAITTKPTAGTVFDIKVEILSTVRNEAIKSWIRDLRVTYPLNGIDSNGIAFSSVVFNVRIVMDDSGAGGTYYNPPIGVSAASVYVALRDAGAYVFPKLPPASAPAQTTSQVIPSTSIVSEGAIQDGQTLENYSVTV